MKKIAIVGFRGFVGSNLSKYLSGFGSEIHSVDRDVLNDADRLKETLDSVDVVINVAGKKILTRWSEKNMSEIYESRVATTKKIVDALNMCEGKKQLISTSAVGIYSDSTHDESSSEFRESFLGKICRDWEGEANKYSGGVVTIFRFGVILHSSGGFIASVKTPFKLFGGSYFGSAKSKIPVVNLNDLLAAYKFVIDNESAGVYNLTSESIENRELALRVARYFGKNFAVKVPAFVIKLILKGGAEPILSNQVVKSKKLVDSGFVFKYSGENLLKEIE